MKERIAKVISQYSQQGDHRTGTAVDNASAEWLAATIGEEGVTPVIESFQFHRTDVVDARLIFEDRDITGVPLFDCGFTDSSGVTGRLGLLGSDAAIGVVNALPYAATAEGVALERARRAGTHRAIVVVADPRLPPGGATLLNAEDYAAPFGPPVLQIANDDWPALEKAASAGLTARVVAHCNLVEAHASNVSAHIGGRRPEAAPIVIMTPRSGWWTCASERGGGIACWLEIMRACATGGTERDLVFTANTGHELGHTGLEHFLSQHRDLVSGAAMWLHLGANFAAAIGGQVRFQYSDQEARAMLRTYASEAGVAPDVETPLGERPLGEARNIHDGRGRYISILGGNGLFHHPADRWPEAVDLDKATSWTNVMTRVALTLASS